MNASRAEAIALPPSLVDRFLDHLRQEQTHWTKVLAAMRAISAALAAGQWRVLAETAVQENLLEENDRLRAARRRICAEAALALRIPVEALTLEQIAHAVATPTRQLLLELRSQLRSRAVEAQGLGRACALRAQFHVDFMQRFFAELTGMSPGGCYSREGTLQPAAGRPLLQARG